MLVRALSKFTSPPLENVSILLEMQTSSRCKPPRSALHLFSSTDLAREMTISLAEHLLDVLELIKDLAREMTISLAEHLLDLLVLELIKDLARDVHSLGEHPRLLRLPPLRMQRLRRLETRLEE